jgi:hypothetical protein
VSPITGVCLAASEAQRMQKLADGIALAEFVKLPR